MASPRSPHGPSARGLVFSALTGRRGADVSGSVTGDVRGMLLAAFGSNPRDPQRPNTRAAAAGLGVSQRTVQRWLARADQEHTAPRRTTMQTLATTAARAARTRRGRAAAMAQAQSGPLSRRGMSISVSGTMGPSQEYSRRRRSVWNLPPEQAQGLMNAFETGGENGALGYLSSNPEIYGLDSFWFGEVSEFDVRPLYGEE